MNKREVFTWEKILKGCLIILLVLGVVIVFYKLPSIIAAKINYAQLKRKEIKQDLTEEE